MGGPNIDTLLNRLGRQPWNVRVQERYGNGVSVAGYLARYITGGPISSKRLHAVSDSEVAFHYRDFRDGRQKIMRLKPVEFLRRWFEHVPPRGMRLIRRSGLYANCHAELRTQIRNDHQRDSKRKSAPTVTLDFERCPKCNTIIQTIEICRPVHRELVSSKPEYVARGQPP